MSGVVTTVLPRCPACSAPISARSSVCALCDAALIPATSSSGGRPAYVSTQADPMVGRDELRPVWAELGQALAPTIRMMGILGEGGMGIVFVGLDETLRREVAIKVLSPRVADDPVARLRFRREAEAAAAVSHPNIVSVFQVGELPESGLPYIVMQYVDGPTLADAIGRSLPEARVRRLMVEIASALAAAHRRRVVHRDVKPANIALDGETGRALVLDFGISAALSSRRRSSKGMRLTTEGMYLGTPTYMSPEQASGDDVTTKSDVYSLGVLMYELLAGEPPFHGNSIQILAAHVRDEPLSLLERRPDLSSELVALIERCLAKEPTRRPTAQEVVNYFQPSSQHVIEWPPPGLSPLRRAGARLLDVTFMLAIATLVFFVALGLQPSLTRPGQLADGAIGEVAASWSFVLAACVVILGILAVLLAFRAWRTIGFARLARASGYPWKVVFAVATDRRGDTGELRNRKGAYAMLDENECERLRLMRRGQTISVLLSAPVAVATALLWIAGGLRWAGSDAGRVLPPGEAAIVVVPIALCLAVGLILLNMELRLVARARGNPRGRRHTVIRPDLVQSWLTASGEAAAASSRLLPRPLAAIGLIAVGAATAAATAAILTIVGDTTARLVPARAAAAEWVAMLQTDSLRPPPWTLVESMISSSALGASADSHADEVARAFVASFVPDAAPPHAAWIVGQDGLATQRPPREPLVGHLSLAALATQMAESRDPARLTVDTTSPRLAAFRRLARTPLLPMLWPYREGLPGAASSLGLPSLSAAAIRSVGYTNGAAGLVALRRGDTAAALLRARENVSVARHLLRQLVESGAANAAVLLIQASDLIHAVSVVARQPILAGEADRLARAADEVRRPMRQHYRARTLALFADPGDASAVRFIRSPALSPTTRASLQTSAILGHCLNAREMLFGLDARRAALLDSVSVALADVPRSADLVDADRRWVRWWLANQRRAATANLATVAQVNRPSLLVRSLGWIGLGAVRDRMLFCRAMAD